MAVALLVWLAACARAAGPATLFEDHFDDARHGWTVASSAQADMTINGGQLLITLKKPDALAWTILAGKSFESLTLDVDATPLAGPDDNDYGVIVRHVDDDNFYRFEISGDGYYNIQKRVKGKWEKLGSGWTPADAIRTGRTTNHLCVTCAGGTCTFAVNQVQLAQINDAAFARGQIGLFAGTLAVPGVQVAFDNLKVSR